MIWAELHFLPMKHISSGFLEGEKNEEMTFKNFFPNLKIELFEESPIDTFLHLPLNFLLIRISYYFNFLENFSIFSKNFSRTSIIIEEFYFKTQYLQKYETKKITKMWLTVFYYT